MSGPPPKPAPTGAGVWPVGRRLSPTSLKTYVNCPFQARLKYVDRVKRYAPYSIFLQEGTLAHNMLSEAAKRLRDQALLRSEDELLRTAFDGMRADAFPSDAAHEASARKIVRWYKAGLAHLDPDARFLIIEGEGTRNLALPSDPSVQLTMETRPDLILLRTDGDGQPFVEIVDYKTGSIWIDPIPPIAMRYVFKRLFQTIAEDTLALPMQFSYVFLEHGVTEVVPLTPEYCAEAWSDVLHLVERLVAEREWPATPSTGCNYCPYHQRECQESAPSGQDWE